MKSILQAFHNRILPAGAQLLQADDPVAIGGHRLVGRLRCSGTGIVYLACGGGSGLVAIKTSQAATDQAVARSRLRAEAACARRLPAFCTADLLHDGTEQTPPYLVSEYLNGPSLEQVVDVTGPLAPATVTALATGLARALAAVHDAGVIHGNLTPANVLFTKDGVRVIDFGVVPEISTSGEPADIGAVADHPGWLAPELLTGGSPSPACDVFAWGCLMAYAVSGHSPHGRTRTGESGRPAHVRPLEATATDELLRRLVDASRTADPAGRPTAADLTSRLGALAGTGADDQPAPDRPTGPAAHDVGHRASPGRSGPSAPTAGRSRHRARAVVSVVVTLAASLLLATPTATGPHPGPATSPGTSHSPQPPPESFRGPPLRPRQAGPRPSHRRPAAPATSDPRSLDEPSWLRRALRSWNMMKPRRPVKGVPMSCAVRRPGRCSAPGIKPFSSSERPPGRTIGWTPAG